MSSCSITGSSSLFTKTTTPAWSLTHLWYRIGSNQEEPGQTGLSHAVEHMLFNGSSKLCSGESGHILQNLGGSQNATTLNDATLYFHTVPAHALGVSFEILADQMSTAHLSATRFGRRT
jgi:zinc protease